MVINLKRSKIICEVSSWPHWGGIILMELMGLGRPKVKVGSAVSWAWPLDLKRRKLAKQEHSLSSFSGCGTVWPAATGSRCLSFPSETGCTLVLWTKANDSFSFCQGILSAVGTVTKILVVTIKLSVEVSQNIKYRLHMPFLGLY